MGDLAGTPKRIVRGEIPQPAVELTLSYTADDGDKTWNLGRDGKPHRPNQDRWVARQPSKRAPLVESQAR